MLEQKANSTLRASRAVPHPSTDRAFRRLTSEFGWDRVHSTKYGRRRHGTRQKSHQQKRKHQKISKNKMQKAYGTRRTSQAVPHPSTIRALRCLTSEFGWDRVYSTQYGRWRRQYRSERSPLDRHCRIWKFEFLDDTGRLQKVHQPRIPHRVRDKVRGSSPMWTWRYRDMP